MAETSTVSGVECAFNQAGIFYFRVQFFLDEFFTRLTFQETSKDNPTHFFINNKPVSSGGFMVDLDTCYNLTYSPLKQFLKDTGLMNQVFYIKLDAILIQLIDTGLKS